MAYKQIYICDLCQKYIDKAPFTISVMIDHPDSGAWTTKGMGGEPSYIVGAVDREVCSGCAQEIFEKLRLDMGRDQITEEVFKGLNLLDPTSQVDVSIE